MNKPLFICYPKCSTCQKAEKYLQAKGVDYEFRHIVEHNPTAEELTQWIEKSGLPVNRFFNTSGLRYKALNMKEKVKTLPPDELIALLASEGMLVKRPLLITDTRVLVGFKESDYDSL